MNPTVGKIVTILTNEQTRLGRRGEGKESKTVDNWIDLKLVGTIVKLNKTVMSRLSFTCQCV